MQVDVSQLGSVEALAERSYRELGGCHLLCNNAGVFVVGSIQSRTAKDWEWVLGVNLWGVVHGLLAFLPRMLAQPGEKHIVNTASIAGLIPTAGRRRRTRRPSTRWWVSPSTCAWIWPSTRSASRCCVRAAC